MTRISQYSELASGNVADGDLVPITDVSDTSASAEGTTKNVAVSSLGTKIITDYFGVPVSPTLSYYGHSYSSNVFHSPRAGSSNAIESSHIYIDDVDDGTADIIVSRIAGAYSGLLEKPAVSIGGEIWVETVDGTYYPGHYATFLVEARHPDAFISYESDPGDFYSTFKLQNDATGIWSEEATPVCYKQYSTNFFCASRAGGAPSGMSLSAVVATNPLAPSEYSNFEVFSDGEAGLYVNGSNLSRIAVSDASASYLNQIRLGNSYLWVDNSGDLRISASIPTSDTDGVVVGTQS